MITSVMIDNREPPSITRADYGTISSTTTLEVGDAWATTNDGVIIVVERKTISDLLQSIKDERLFNQVADMAAMDRNMYMPYLAIEGSIISDNNGKVIADGRLTGWNWNAVQGALLTVLEMGVPIIYFMPGDFPGCIRRLGDRERGDITIIPRRAPKNLGEGAEILLSLPGVGLEMLQRIWQESGGVVAHALWLLSDPEVESSVPVGTRKRVRKALGLNDNLTMAIGVNNAGQEILQTFEEVPDGE